jgi:ATP/ADP translocase
LFNIQQVYVSLDYESRFLGKEIIGLTVNRFGKSLMALTTAGFGLSLDLDYVRSALALVALLWLVATYRLVRLVDISEVKSKTE